MSSIDLLIAFGVGFFIGRLVGFFIAALLAAGGRNNDA